MLAKTSDKTEIWPEIVSRFVIIVAVVGTLISATDERILSNGRFSRVRLLTYRPKTALELLQSCFSIQIPE